MPAVPHIMPTFDSSAAKTRAVGSSIRLAQPIMNGCNHALGHLLCGPVFWHAPESTPASGTSMSRSFYMYRHPNSIGLHVMVYAGAATSEDPSPGISVTAGTGTTVSTSLTYGHLINRWHEFFPLWNSGDSGYCEVTIAGTELGFGAVMVQDIVRVDLDPSSDECLTNSDSSYPGGGLREGRYIIDSTSAGPKGMVDLSTSAWKYNLRQGPTWWTISGDKTVNSTSWTNPLGSGVTWRFQARQKKNESTRDHRVYAYTHCDATVTSYEIRMSSNTDTVTSSSLSHTSYAWTGTPLTGLAIDCTTYDTLTFEMRRTGGTGLLYVQRIAVPEEVV